MQTVRALAALDLDPVRMAGEAVNAFAFATKRLGGYLGT